MVLRRVRSLLSTGGGCGGGYCRRWCALAPGSPTRRRYHVDLETLLVALYVLVEDWWKDNRSRARRGPGRRVSLSDAEVLTLAILSQWPRWRSERDFCRFADAHLRPYFPNLLSQSQLNRRIRAVEPELKVLQRDLLLTCSATARRSTTSWAPP